MLPDFQSIPYEIRLHLRKLTMAEDMLLSPVLPIMSVYRIRSGQTLHRGYIANFRQDNVPFLKEIPRLPSTLPLIIVKRQGEDNQTRQCRVNRARVQAVAQFLISSNPFFVSNNIKINADNLSQLPEDGILQGLAEIILTDAEAEAIDQGPTVVVEANDDDEPACVFVEEYDVGGEQAEILRQIVDQQPQDAQLPEPVAFGPNTRNQPPHDAPEDAQGLPEPVAIGPNAQNQPPQDAPEGLVADWPDIQEHQRHVTRGPPLENWPETPDAPGPPVANWPDVDTAPINEFRENQLASLAFVKLFPLGKADPTNKDRRLDVKENDATIHLLRYAEYDPLTYGADEDPSNGTLYYPFAEHERFQYWMNDRIRRHRSLSQTTVYLKKNPQDAALSIDDLRTMLRDGSWRALMSRLFAYSANITGSDGYWHQRRQELEAIFQQKGPGTLFFTFSYADNHWEDLHRLMPGGLKEPRLRYRQVGKNPHLVDWYFSTRLEEFIRCYFRDTLDMEWIWHRYEWQSRTAIHAHGVVKLKNDPGIADLVVRVYRAKVSREKLESGEDDISHEESDKLRKDIEYGDEAEGVVLKYVESLLTAMNPRDIQTVHAVNEVPDPHPCSKNISESIGDDEAMDIDYEDLCNCCQRHVCRPNGYCKPKRPRRRANSADGEAATCRFGYPQPLSEVCKIEFETVGETGVRAKLVLKRNDENVNVHNRVMLQHWRANVDMQIILDYHAALSYMVKYASKPEKSGRQLDAILRNAVNSSNDGQSSAASALRSVMIRTVDRRDIGAGETSRLLSKGNHCQSTFKYVRQSLEIGTLAFQVNGTREDVSEVKNLLYYFARRRELQQHEDYHHLREWLDQPNLIEFCRNFAISRGKLARRQGADQTIVICFPNFHGTKGTDNYKKFCKYALIKYSDWDLGDIDALQNEDDADVRWEVFEETASADLLKYCQGDLELRRKLRDVLEEVSQLGTHDNEEEYMFHDEWMDMSRLRPQEEQEATLNLVPNWEFDWKNLRMLFYTVENLDSGPGFVEDAKRQGAINEGNAGLPPVDRNELNALQGVWYDLTIDAIERGKQLLLIVVGKAGTGKSHTIAAISNSMEASQLIRAAFTAKAAFLIKGTTIHSAFSIPVEMGSRIFKPLTNEALKKFQEKMKGVKLIIIDEFSMLSQDLLAKIDKRLREATGKSHLLFGGISVILVGDHSQLLPVGGVPLYGSSERDYCRHGEMLYKDGFKDVVRLDEMVRQIREGDGGLQDQFVDLLDNLHDNAECTIEQWQLLMSRTRQRIGEEVFKRYFADAVRLFAENADVNAYNAERLKELKQPIILFRAECSSFTAKRMEADKFRGLELDLFLCIGASITLTTNLWIDAGLVNGAKGKVVDIVYGADQDPKKDLPSFVVIDFESYSGVPFFRDDVAKKSYVPLSASTFFSDDHRHSRRQFPFRLAYAMTIHKSQGQTLDKAVIDLGKSERSLGLTFVALSRVRHIKDLVIAPCSYERLDGIKKSKVLASRLAEDKRLEQLALNTLARVRGGEGAQAMQ
jgi:hypothetical protein